MCPNSAELYGVAHWAEGQGMVVGAVVCPMAGSQELPCAGRSQFQHPITCQTATIQGSPWQSGKFNKEQQLWGAGEMVEDVVGDTWKGTLLRLGRRHTSGKGKPTPGQGQPWANHSKAEETRRNEQQRSWIIESFWMEESPRIIESNHSLTLSLNRVPKSLI